MVKMKLINRTKLLTFIVFFIFFFSPINIFLISSVTADQNDSFYVSSSSGDDGNSGMSPEQAWQTIGKVNSELNDGVINTGDNIYFKRGDVFNDASLIPRIGGTSNNYMVFGAYGEGSKPVINGTNYGIWFQTANANYIIIQDLSLENSSITGIFANVNLSNIVVSHVDVIYSGGTSMYFDNTIDLWIKNCTILDSGYGGIVLYGSPSNRLSHVIVEDTFISGNDYPASDGLTIHKDDFGNEVGSHFLIRNVTATGYGEQGFDFTSGENILLLDSEAYDNGDSSIMLAHGVKNITIIDFYSHDELVDSTVYGIIIGESNQVIMRNSRFLNIRTYPISLTPGSINVNFYNNIVVYGPDTTNGAGCFFTTSGTENFISKNNIFYSPYTTVPTNRWVRYINSHTVSNTNSLWSRNVWWRGDGGGNGDQRWWIEGSTYLTYANWIAKPQVDGDLRVNPELTDPLNGDFRLNATSPCIDAGAWLTHTIGSGSGTTITLGNADYFIDGYGMIDGDSIFVGDNKNLMVTSVDYINNQVTVNRSITWNNNDYVSMYLYYGDKVDIGAFEYEIKDNDPPIPPNMPQNPNPTDKQNNVSRNAVLTWTGDDPNGTPVTFDVYFGIKNPPSQVSWNQSNSNYDPEMLMYDTKYYWRIVIWNTHDIFTIGPVWSFTTVSNQLPYRPSDPSPDDTSDDVNQNINLGWSGGDPDGDPVTYDVYFGTDNSPPLLISDLEVKTYNPGTLAFNTRYYWRVVSKDDQGATASGPLWQFTTMQQRANGAPDTPHQPSGLLVVNKNVSTSYYTYSEDPDGDYVYYKWDWGDGLISNWVGPFVSGSIANASHRWEEEGSYEIKVKARDSSYAESDWSDGLTVIVEDLGPKADAGGSYTGLMGEPIMFQGFVTRGQPPYQWYWDFGDENGISNERDPVYLYEESGVYTVSLTVTDANDETDTDTSEVYISSDDHLFVSTDGPYQSYVDETIFFNAIVSGGNSPYFYHWNFGDGSISNERNPTHAFTKDAQYTIILTVTDSSNNTLTSTAVTTATIIKEAPVPTAILTYPVPGFFYLAGSKAFPISETLAIILGRITIEVDVTDTLSGIASVDFYIDDSLRKTLTEEPYRWTWRDIGMFKHVVRVVVNANNGNTATDSIEVIKLF